MKTFATFAKACAVVALLALNVQAKAVYNPTVIDANSTTDALSGFKHKHSMHRGDLMRKPELANPDASTVAKHVGSNEARPSVSFDKPWLAEAEDDEESNEVAESHGRLLGKREAMKEAARKGKKKAKTMAKKTKGKAKKMAQKTKGKAKKMAKKTKGKAKMAKQRAKAKAKKTKAKAKMAKQRAKAKAKKAKKRAKEAAKRAKRRAKNAGKRAKAAAKRARDRVTRNPDPMDDNFGDDMNDTNDMGIDDTMAEDEFEDEPMTDDVEEEEDETMDDGMDEGGDEMDDTADEEPMDEEAV